jgi:hypothetical protein
MIMRRTIERSTLWRSSDRVRPSRASASWNCSSLVRLLSFLMVSMASSTYCDGALRPASSAFCMMRTSSIASCRMRALFWRRNWPTVVGSTRAAWAAASWRDWNSERVMIWPFTLATTFSMTSGRASPAASRTSALGTARTA